MKVAFRWVHRLSVPMAAAFVITLALLTIMRSLVGVGSDAMERKYPRVVADYIRVTRAETTATKERALPPKKTTPTQAWTPRVAVANDAPKSAVPVRMPIQSTGIGKPGLSLAGAPSLGEGGAEGDVVPLVRVNPLYPPKARARRVEGWVWLEFTITPQGTTSDIRILDADPRGYFEKAALGAVQKYRYKPRILDGRPVERSGVQVVLSFDIAS